MLLRVTLVWTFAQLMASVHGTPPFGCYQEVVDQGTVTLTCIGVDPATLDAFLSVMDAAVAPADVLLQLELRESALTELPPDFLAPYPIRSLTFFNDSLTEFPRAILTNVRSGLVVLDVSANYIVQLLDDAFDGLPFVDTLQVLVLTRNAISTVPGTNPFGTFQQLQKLFLQLNDIAGLPDDAFADLPTLTELHLYGNEIETIAPNAFGNLPALQRLYLNENHIQYLHNETLSDEKVPALKKIYLGNNPFYCNCSLNWLKMWLNDRNLIFDSDATCTYPLTEPFSLTIFCPIENQYKQDNNYKSLQDRHRLRDMHDRYIQYAMRIILQDRREREFRLTHRIK